MKKLLKPSYRRKIAAALIVFLSFTSIAAAQDRARVVNEGFWTNEPYAWYAQPWVWALIAGIIVMVIFVVTKGGRKSRMEPDSEEGTVHE